MNKKAFTLIELLAVIILIGVIAVITLPKISDSLENSRKNAVQTSTYGYEKAVEEFTLSQEMNKNKIKLDGVYNIDEYGNIYNEEEYYELGFDGKKPKNGILTYDQNEIIYGCITIDKYTVIIEDGEVISIEKGTCEYDKMLTPTELQRQEEIKSLAASYIISLQQSEYEGSGIANISEITSYVNYNMEPPSGGWVSLLYNETNGITIFEYSLKYGTNEVVTFDGSDQSIETAIAKKPSIAYISGVDGKTLGDEIAIGTEHFYVLSYDSSTGKTTALAKANLNVGKYKNNNLTEGMQGEVGVNYGVMFFTSCFFGDINSPDTSYVVPQYRIGSTNKAITYDPVNYSGAPGTNNYSVAYYVKEYGNNLEISRNDLHKELRLLTKDEYTSYRLSIQTILESQRFFLGTGYVSYNSTTGKISCMIDYKYNSSIGVAASEASVLQTTPGVRPVIEFNKANSR